MERLPTDVFRDVIGYCDVYSDFNWQEYSEDCGITQEMSYENFNRFIIFRDGQLIRQKAFFQKMREKQKRLKRIRELQAERFAGPGARSPSHPRLRRPRGRAGAAARAASLHR